MAHTPNTPALTLHRLAIASAESNRTPRSMVTATALPEWDRLSAFVGSSK